MGALSLILAVDHVMSAIEWGRGMAKDREVKVQSQVRPDIRATTEKKGFKNRRMGRKPK